MEWAPATTIAPERLAAFPAFRDFTRAELVLLLAEMRRLDLRAGTVLYAEGDAGATCIVVVEGVLDVSVKVRGQPQLLAQLGPGSLVGQASLIDAGPRASSCSVREDAVLAEVERDACERLLGGRSPIALKLLAALNRGLVDALRDADRRLMRLEAERESGGRAAAWSAARPSAELAAVR
jgi:CRP-like cAMP-binding protein